jgi:hypothetical protein
MKKLPKAVKFGLILFVLALTSGIGSGLIAYNLGVQALKGINQPDNNPSKKFSPAQGVSARPQPFKPIDEAEVIKKTAQVILDKQAQAKKEAQKSP